MPALTDDTQHPCRFKSEWSFSETKGYQFLTVNQGRHMDKTRAKQDPVNFGS